MATAVSAHRLGTPGIAAQTRLLVGVHPFEQGHHSRIDVARCGGFTLQGLHGSRQMSLHAMDRIERCEGVLKNHLHVSECAGTFPTFISDTCDSRRRRFQSQDHASDGTLARAGLTDNGDDFPLGKFRWRTRPQPPVTSCRRGILSEGFAERGWS